MSEPPRQSGRPAVERVRPPDGPYVVINRVVRWLLTSPRRASRIGRHLLLLHVVGRVSGRRFDVPVAYRHTADGRLLVLTSSRWRVNLRGAEQVEVTLMGRRTPARVELVEDPERVAPVYRSLIEEVGSAKAARRLGVRVTVGRVPTVEEVADAVEREGLALVHLEPRAGTP